MNDLYLPIQKLGQYIGDSNGEQLYREEFIAYAGSLISQRDYTDYRFKTLSLIIGPAGGGRSRQLSLAEKQLSNCKIVDLSDSTRAGLRGTVVQGEISTLTYSPCADNDIVTVGEVNDFFNDASTTRKLSTLMLKLTGDDKTSYNLGGVGRLETLEVEKAKMHGITVDKVHNRVSFKGRASMLLTGHYDSRFILYEWVEPSFWSRARIVVLDRLESDILDETTKNLSNIRTKKTMWKDFKNSYRDMTNRINNVTKKSFSKNLIDDYIDEVRTIIGKDTHGDRRPLEIVFTTAFIKSLMRTEPTASGIVELVAEDWNFAKDVYEEYLVGDEYVRIRQEDERYKWANALRDEGYKNYQIAKLFSSVYDKGASAATISRIFQAHAKHTI